MDEFEETSQELEDPFQSALAMRWRLDFNDWRLNTFADVPSENGHQKLKRLKGLLDQTKVYQEMTEKISDVHLKRDAIKRVMNVYLEIGQGEPPFKTGETEVFATLS